MGIIVCTDADIDTNVLGTAERTSKKVISVKISSKTKNNNKGII